MKRWLNVLFLLVGVGLFFSMPPMAWSADAPSAAVQMEKINVNTASAAELTALPGVGEAIAQAIVEYRDNNGAFRSVDDLLQVKGIGEKKLAALRDWVTLE